VATNAFVTAFLGDAWAVGTPANPVTTKSIELATTTRSKRDLNMASPTDSPPILVDGAQIIGLG
jgi:hypothetical protein